MRIRERLRRKPKVDPTVAALIELRNAVKAIPVYDLDVSGCIQRSAVLAAIGEALSIAEVAR